MKEAINFLKHIYSGSIPNIANILVAEAEGDKEVIQDYLLDTREYIDKLLKELYESKEDIEAPEVDCLRPIRTGGEEESE